MPAIIPTLILERARPLNCIANLLFPFIILSLMEAELLAELR